MIIGAHTVIFSEDADRTRAFLRDVLGLPHVDAGGGWLIFRSPPAELAVHPAAGAGQRGHALYLVCDDINQTITDLAAKGVASSEISDERWGWTTSIELPGAGTLGIYQAKHPVAFS